MSKHIIIKIENFKLFWNKIWNSPLRQAYEIIVESKHVTLTCIYAAYYMQFIYIFYRSVNINPNWKKTCDIFRLYTRKSISRISMVKFREFLDFLPKWIFLKCKKLSKISIKNHSKWHSYSLEFFIWK